MVKMLKQLRNQRVVEYDALRNFLRSEIEGADALFIPALDVLFLLDLSDVNFQRFFTLDAQG